MTQCNLTALILTSTLTLSAAASRLESGGTRGGGNAHICFDDPSIPAEIRRVTSNGTPVDPAIQNEHIPHITSIEMLDLYEYRQNTGFGPTPPPAIVRPLPGESLTGYVKRLMVKLKEFNPYFLEEMQDALELIPESTAIGHENGIDPVNDYNLFGRINNKYCVVGTVLLHMKTDAQMELHYDARLWNHPKFDVSQKYIAYLHEIVYLAQRRKSGWAIQDSQDARKIVGWLLREKMTPDENKLFWEKRIDANSIKYGISQMNAVNLVFEFKGPLKETLDSASSILIRNTANKIETLTKEISDLAQKIAGKNSIKEYHWEKLKLDDHLRYISFSYKYKDGIAEVLPYLKQALQNLKKAANLERKFYESSERKKFRDAAEAILQKYGSDLQDIISSFEKGTVPHQVKRELVAQLETEIQNWFPQMKDNFPKAKELIQQHPYLLPAQKQSLIQALTDASERNPNQIPATAQKVVDVLVTQVDKPLTVESIREVYKMINGFSSDTFQPIQMDIQ